MIIEPFAGSAGYSLHYAQRKILLCDIDPVICSVWDYLIKASVDDILRLPTVFDDVRDLRICQEAKWLIGFWLNQGSSHPCNIPSKRMRDRSNHAISWCRPGVENLSSWWGKEVKLRIADQIEMIRHWKIRNISYRQIENQAVTWFIDPPYQGKSGRRYRINHINFSYLAEWCRDRLGQIIVCEQGKANWLPFVFFRNAQVGKGLNQEVIWYNEKT